MKRVLFLGGALLVLAACSDSTAPNAGARAGGEVAFSKAKKDTTTTTITTTITSAGEGEPSTDCRTGYLIVAGRSDSTCGDGAGY